MHDVCRADDRAVVGAVRDRAAVIVSRNTCRHHPAGADDAAVGTARDRTLFRVACRDAADVHAAGDRCIVHAGFDRSAVLRRDTGSVVAALERTVRGAARDRAGIACRQNGAFVAADDNAGHVKIFERTAVRGKQRRAAALIFAVELRDGKARAVQLAREAAVHRRPVAVVEVDVRRQNALDGRRCRRVVREPLEVRRACDLVHAADIRGLGLRGFAVPAVGVDGGMVRIDRLIRAAALPLEDGIAAVDVPAVRCELIAEVGARQGFQLVRRFEGCPGDRARNTEDLCAIQPIDLFKRFLL